MFGAAALTAAMRCGVFGSHYLHIDESDKTGETGVKYINESNDRAKVYNMPPVVLSFGLFDTVLGSTSTKHDSYNLSRSMWLSKPFFRPVHISWSSDRDDLQPEYKLISDMRIPMHRVFIRMLSEYDSPDSTAGGERVQDTIIKVPDDLEYNKYRKDYNNKYQTQYSHRLHGLIHFSESTGKDNWYMLDVPYDFHTTLRPYGDNHKIDNIETEHDHFVFIREEINRIE